MVRKLCDRTLVGLPPSAKLPRKRESGLTPSAPVLKMGIQEVIYSYAATKSAPAAIPATCHSPHVREVRSRGTALAVVETLLLPCLSLFLCAVRLIQSPRNPRVRRTYPACLRGRDTVEKRRSRARH